MNTKTILAVMSAVFALSQINSRAQTQLAQYYVTLRATSYQTNGSSSFVPVTITERTLVQDIALTEGLNPSALALVYTVVEGGDGDTIDVVNTYDGSSVQNVFGLFYAGNPTYGRSAATNDVETEIRGLDEVFTQANFTWTSWNKYNMGVSFSTKRTFAGANGNIHTTVDGQVHWLVNPQSGNGTKIIKGTFTTTRPFKPTG